MRIQRKHDAEHFIAADNPHYLPLRTTLTQALYDMDANGWDQPARLYLVMGTLQDPYLKMYAELTNGHPYNLLQAMYDAGERLPKNALGVAMACEAWRAREFEEITGSAKDGMEEMIAEMLRMGLPGSTEELVRGLIRERFEELTAAVMPSDLPDFLRLELRSVSAVLRDGTTLNAAHTRDKSDADEYANASDGTLITMIGRMPLAMHDFLHNRRPGTTEMTEADLGDTGQWVEEEE